MMKNENRAAVNAADDKIPTEKYPARYSVCVSTHPGSKRAENEDNFVINNVVRIPTKDRENLFGGDIAEPLVCGVFDGMGGEANGELASRIAAETSVTIYKTLRKEPVIPDALVDEYVNKANKGITDMLSRSKAGRGGSACVIVALLNDAVFSYSLGDSRLYLYSGGELRQISNDHTLAMRKYLANIYTLEEAKSSPDSHKLTAFLGLDSGDGLAAEKYPPFRLGADEALLLCSDGLYDTCSDEEIAALLRDGGDKVSLALVERAVENGGIDNVTCIVIRKEQQPDSSNPNLP